jgi:hypothetical protein
MTKQEIIEHCGKSVYQIWLDLAMRHFDVQNPTLSFVFAEKFIAELLSQNPKF